MKIKVLTHLRLNGILKQLLFVFIFTGLCYTSTLASDSIKTKIPQFFSVNTTTGYVFPTNKFVAGDYSIPHYTSFTIKYGFGTRGDKWEDYAYGLPTLGVGFYMANFFRDHDIGTPFSLFLFQGARIRQFTPRLSLNYEWNLGVSFNWKPYDPFDNPNNIALGSSTNVHVAGNLFLNWRLSKKWDLNGGAGFTHFSNGASALPNSGLNMANLFVEIVYNFNREEPKSLFNNPYIPPPFEKHIDHDLMFMATSRNARIDTLNTGLPSEFTNRNFTVLGISYARMFHNSYRYKFGPGIDITYDESSGITVSRQKHPETGKTYDRIKLGNFADRFSVGLSVKGEMAMPAYSVFANLGYDIIHGNKKDARLYQILGVKIYLTDSFFGTFGIRATNFGKAQYLYWNLGYTFEQHRRKKRE